MENRSKKISQALEVLGDLGMPRAQINERTALCFLALLNLTEEKLWSEIETPLIGITPIMTWSLEHYQKKYAPNTRETFRRQSMHQFIEAGIALYNPDNPERPVNSPKAVYQIEPTLFTVLVHFGKAEYKSLLEIYLKSRKSLVERYAKEREMTLIPIQIENGKEILISVGDHSKLIKDIIEQFAPRFVPDAKLIYVGDTQDKWGYFDETLLNSLGVAVDNHGKMPDVVIYYPAKHWLLLIESVTSHGPMDNKRHDELSRLFATSKVGLVFVSAFPNKKTMNKYLDVVSWETEVWIADAPTHMIHFNGVRFLGPYDKSP